MGQFEGLSTQLRASSSLPTSCTAVGLQHWQPIRIKPLCSLVLGRGFISVAGIVAACSSFTVALSSKQRLKVTSISTTMCWSLNGCAYQLQPHCSKGLGSFRNLKNVPHLAQEEGKRGKKHRTELKEGKRFAACCLDNLSVEIRPVPVCRSRDRSWRCTNQRKGQVRSCWFRRRNQTGSSPVAFTTTKL